MNKNQKAKIVAFGIIVSLLSFTGGMIWQSWASNGVTDIEKSNLVFSGSGGFPASPGKGQMFYRTDLGKLYLFDGDWEEVGKQEPYVDATAASYVVDTNSTHVWMLNSSTGQRDWTSTDTDAIIQAVVDNLTNGGGAFIKAGAYPTCDSDILITNQYISIIGEGSGSGTTGATVLTWTGATNGFVIDPHNAGADLRNFQIKHMVLRDEGGSGLSGIKVNGSASNHAATMEFADLLFSGWTSQIDLTYAYHVVIEHTKHYGSATHAIFMGEDANAVTVRDGSFYGTFTYCIKMEGESLGGAPDCSGNIIEDSWFEAADPQTYGLYMTKTELAKVTNNYFKSQTYAIWLEDTVIGCDFIGNVIRETKQHAVVLKGASVNNNKFIGGHITKIGLDGADTYDGIYLNTTSGSIQKNIFMGITFKATSYTRYCVGGEGNNPYDNSIIDNMMEDGFVTAGIYAIKQNSGSENTIRDNHGYDTETWGYDTIASGSTTDEFAHGLVQIPIVVLITWKEDITAGGERFWVTMNATHVVVNLSESAASDLDYSWYATTGIYP